TIHFSWRSHLAHRCPRPLHKQAGECEATRAATPPLLPQGLASLWLKLMLLVMPLLLPRFHSRHDIGPPPCAHFPTQALPVVVSMWKIQNAETSSRLTVATRPVPSAKR